MEKKSTIVFQVFEDYLEHLRKETMDYMGPLAQSLGVPVRQVIPVLEAVSDEIVRWQEDVDVAEERKNR